MTNLGLVSIITPSYNSSLFIVEMIESIISQTYANWELLITDDCSTDNSCEIIDSYVRKDARIRLFRLEKNSGAGVARNYSIRMAMGRFIAFCDSDDCWYPEKLNKQLAFMLEKRCSFSYTSYMTCNENSAITGIVVCNKTMNYRSLKKDNGIGCLTVIYDSYSLGKNYFPRIRKRQDWGLWLKIIEKSGIAYGMKEPLAIYRIRLGSLSCSKLSIVKYNIAIYKQILKYSSVRAYWVFLFSFLPNYFLKKIRLYIINI